MIAQDIDYSSIEDEDNVSTLQRNISILSDAYNENTHTSEVPNKAGTLAPLNPDFIKYQPENEYANKKPGSSGVWLSSISCKPVTSGRK